LHNYLAICVWPDADIPDADHPEALLHTLPLLQDLGVRLAILLPESESK
jgi:hypothetical protein